VFTAAGAPGLPAGELALPDLTVAREGLTRTFEVSSASLVVELRKNGAPLPDAAAGKDRGAVQLGTTRLRFPATGPARLTVKTWPGVAGISYVCDGACADLPPFITPVPRVKAGP
jgi:hypothetical protein